MKQEARNFLHRILRPFEAVADRCLLAAGARRPRRPGDGSPGGHAPSRILLSRPDLLGDVVLFTAMLRPYRESFPDAHIVLLVRETVAPLLDGCPSFDTLWPFPVLRYRADPVERFKWWRRLSGFGFDLAIHAPYSTSWDHYGCLVGWTGARRRVAFRHEGPGRQRTEARPWFSDLVPSSGAWTHAIRRDAEMLGYLTGGEISPPEPVLWLNDRDRRRAAIVRPHGPVGIVSPGAGLPLRRWDPGNFAAVISGLQKQIPRTWLVCGSTDEQSLCRDLAGRLAHSGIAAHDLAGRISLREFAALIESADIVLGNDSAAVHIANAVHSSFVAIMGGGFPGVHVPVGKEERAAALTHHVPCEGCHWRCVQEGPICISNVRAEDVLQAAQRVTKKGEHD